ncbi:MAG TPA: DUF3105 domain-containing protein [Frankiaceae bacterium]|nr:DUF3105 domain-containing protein [Frankiaceae bacterium]
MNRRVVAVVGVVVGALVVLGVIGTLAGDKDEPAPPIAGDLPADVVCQPETAHPPTGASVHRAGEIAYDRVPPNSGEHNPNWLRVIRRVFEPSDGAAVEQAVHNLEHGYVVVWYDPARADLAALEGAIEFVGERKLFAMPWTRGGLPSSYVLTAWGHERRCSGISRAAIRDFFGAHGGENGDAPEANGP